MAKPRKPSYVLTAAGKQKIDAKLSALFPYGYNFSKIAEQTCLCRTTVGKILDLNQGVNLKTLEKFFSNLCLDFQGGDYHLQIDKKPTSKIPVATGKDRPSEQANYSQYCEVSRYVKRPAIEEQCYNSLLFPNCILRIIAPKKMGKTQLINKLLERLSKEKSYQTVYITLLEADSVHFSELNKFLHWLCANVSFQLELPAKLDEWDNLTKTFGSKISCTTYFEQFLLNQLNHPLVLCIDNLDVLFFYDHICQDFLAMLRSWNDKASRNYLWQKLRLVISYATNIDMKMNHNQSPFNLGLAIELSEFTPEQVQEFAQLYQLDWNNFQVGELMNMVGGHPDLICLTIHHLKTCNHMTLEEILTKAPTENSIDYSSHLKEYLLIFKQHPDLVKVFNNIINGEDLGKEETLAIHQLRSMGLVKYQDSKIVVSCELYRLYFQSCLGDV